MAFLLVKGGRDRNGNLMKGYMLYSYLHTLPALWFSQSPMEEAPVNVSQPSPPPPFPLFFHPSITVASQPWPLRIAAKKQVFFVKQPAEREKTHQEGELSGGPKERTWYWMDSAAYPLSRCLITSLLVYHVWTYSCSSGPDSKQIAAAEGL